MKAVSAEEAVAMIPNGATVMVGGFMGVGTPERLLEELVRQRKSGLVLICNDAAVPGLNRNQAYSLETVIPTIDLLTRFSQLADNFERQASILRHQIQNLRRTRDLLLPRLLLGEMHATDTE